MKLRNTMSVISMLLYHLLISFVIYSILPSPARLHNKDSSLYMNLNTKLNLDSFLLLLPSTSFSKVSNLLVTAEQHLHSNIYTSSSKVDSNLIQSKEVNMAGGRTLGDNDDNDVEYGIVVLHLFISDTLFLIHSSPFSYVVDHFCLSKTFHLIATTNDISCVLSLL